MYVAPGYELLQKEELCISCSSKSNCPKYKGVKDFCEKNQIAVALTACDNYNPYKYKVKTVLWPMSSSNGDTSIEFVYRTDDYTQLNADEILCFGGFNSCEYSILRNIESADGDFISTNCVVVDVDVDAKTLNGLKTLQIR
jgi:hypothetical protein